MSTPPPDTSGPQSFRLGDLELKQGGLLLNARLSYTTHGVLNEAGDNCILFPSYFTGNHASNARMIGPGHALDPRRYFIVVPNLFGNGWSTSPSNASQVQHGSAFPRVSIADNVAAQHLLLQSLGVRRIHLAFGWSMGGVQVCHWAVAHPAMVARLVSVCASARCWPQNQAFIEGLLAIMKLQAAAPRQTLAAFGRAYCGWAYGPAFFREERYRELGFETLAALLQYWEDDHLGWNPYDLLCQLWSWQHADPAQDPRFGGNLAAALGSIRARTILMPCDTDRYFTLEENRIEAAMIPGAELRPFISPYGHCAGAPGRFAEPMAQLEATLREVLED
jgi:homoserine O-acetyltransferase/O-succinyltransferase